MCGLAGMISKNSSLVSKDRLENAVRCLRHRGPDAEGVWTNPQNNVALGHRRLSIIDLSEQASQPMHYAGRYTIIHNGEMYNYMELRKKLEQRGHQFLSQSDTEVILASYAEWGKDCLRRLEGMFAFAIWDEQEQILFAARDRFGEKPFFYFHDGEKFLFASESKALWQLGVQKEVNQSMLYNFLSIGYTSNPQNPAESFYQGIQKLPSSCFLEYSLLTGTLAIEKYWQIYAEISESITVKEAIENFRLLFSSSIHKRLRSDVPVGTSLSGGLDSSSVVAFCEQQNSSHYSHHCFTASFAGFEKDERRWSELVSKKFGLKHHLIELNEQEIPGLMAQMMTNQEEPIATASPLAQYKVYEAARNEGVRVLLDGQGADEVLGGYHKYFHWYWQELFRNNELRKSGEYRAARENGIEEKFSLKNKLAALLPQFISAIAEGRRARNAFRHPDFDPDFAFSHKNDLHYTRPSGTELNDVLYFDTFVLGLEDLLRLADRNSMAHGIEVRLPFLDHELVRFLFTLPPQMKIHQGWTKWILRKSVEGELPEEIVWRQDKVGFEPPQKKWMESKHVQEAIRYGKEKLVKEHILKTQVLNQKIKPHNSYAAQANDWRYWSASFLF
ncbi:MAG: asparagine synthase (glutamine-hydrolyzing) [Flavisolibacter sp.]